MRAISLWQPWASAIAVNAKRVETRGWPTSYRGPLAIHAAQRLVKSELLHYASCWNWCGALAPMGWAMRMEAKPWDLLPFGAVVATCTVVDCRPSESFTEEEIDTPRRPEGQHADLWNWTEREMGDFGPGRYGWTLDEVRRLPTPIPYRGAQGFFQVPYEMIAAAFREPA